MKMLKCDKCGKSLLKIDYGKLEIKCPRCGKIIKVEIKGTNVTTMR
jgi:phage FluMu protein Com